MRLPQLQPINLAHSEDFALGVLAIRPALREVMTPDGSEVIEPRVMQVLVALHRAGGGIVTRDDLTMTCWGGRVVGDDAINRVIGRIRRLAAGDSSQSFLVETIRKVGYRLTLTAPAAVNILPALPAPALPAPLPHGWAAVAWLRPFRSVHTAAHAAVVAGALAITMLGASDPASRAVADSLPSDVLRARQVEVVAADAPTATRNGRLAVRIGVRGKDAALLRLGWLVPLRPAAPACADQRLLEPAVGLEADKGIDEPADPQLARLYNAI